MTEPQAVAMAELRVRVSALVRDCDPSTLDCNAPATPEWRARDVLAHMVGVGDDVVNGRMDGIATDAWTAAQVDRRHDVPLHELLDQWEQLGPRFETLLAGAPADIAGQALFDAATHEHDLRHAIGRPGARQSDAMGLAWDWFVDTRTRADAPAIRFRTELRDDIAGQGRARVTVRAPFFELFRASTGRRTAGEIESYEWEPAPDASMLLVAPFFTIRAESLRE
jgi:hypothetical protein